MYEAANGIGSARVFQRAETIERVAGNVTDALTETDRLLHALNDEIAGIETRITPALRPSMGVPGSGVGIPTASPEPVRCNLAGSLVDVNRRLMDSIQRVRELAARVDL